MNSIYIKKIYTENPGVDVIELFDGTFIVINEETICLYTGPLFENNEGNQTVLRPQSIDQREFICVWGRGYSTNKPETHNFSFFTVHNGFDRDSIVEIDKLTVGESHTVADKHYAVSAVRTK